MCLTNPLQKQLKKKKTVIRTHDQMIISLAVCHWAAASVYMKVTGKTHNLKYILPSKFGHISLLDEFKGVSLDEDEGSAGFT